MSRCGRVCLFVRMYIYIHISLSLSIDIYMCVCVRVEWVYRTLVSQCVCVSLSVFSLAICPIHLSMLSLPVPFFACLYLSIFKFVL